MGNKESSEISNSTKEPPSLVQKELVGTTYLIEYRSSHYSVIIDTSGETTPFTIIGKELTLTNIKADSLERRPDKQYFSRKELTQCYTIGLLPHPEDLFEGNNFTLRAQRWCASLDIAAERFYKRFREKWPRARNPSHMFAASLILSLFRGY